MSQEELKETNISNWKDGSFTFPFDSNYKWTVKDLGPLHIPKVGESAELDSLNIKLYRLLIEFETGQSLKRKYNKINLNDSLVTKYTFKSNYYFMAGDNVSKFK